MVTEKNSQAKNAHAVAYFGHASDASSREIGERFRHHASVSASMLSTVSSDPHEYWLKSTLNAVTRILRWRDELLKRRSRHRLAPSRCTNIFFQGRATTCSEQHFVRGQGQRKGIATACSGKYRMRSDVGGELFQEPQHGSRKRVVPGVRHHARAQAPAPPGKERKHQAINTDEQHARSAFIPVGRAEDDCRK